MIGGASVKEWEINSWKKRIPEYLINDLKFISALSEAVGNYSVGDLVICLDKIKSEAWRLTALWKDKHKEAHLFKKLWKLQTLVKKLRTTWIFRKDSPAHPFTSLEAELREAAAENWDNPLKGWKWRLKIILQMIKVGLSWISSLEQQLGVFLDNHPAHSNKKSSSKVRGVIVDDILSCDSSSVREAIKGFWGDLLGTECPYDPKALDELFDNHPFHFPDSENHTVDLLKVEKLLFWANHTSASPDGIPFSLYWKTYKKYQEMWVELIQQAEESIKFLNSFGESQLCLIPKVENIPYPNCYEPCLVVFYSIWCHPVTLLLQLITALSLSLFPFSVVFFPLYYFLFSYFSWCLFYPFLIWFCPCFLPQKCCFCVPFYSCHDHISTVFSLPSHSLSWANVHLICFLE